MILVRTGSEWEREADGEGVLAVWEVIMETSRSERWYYFLSAPVRCYRSSRGWIRQCVCMRVCVRHHMDINLRGMRNQLPSANANQL